MKNVTKTGNSFFWSKFLRQIKNFLIVISLVVSVLQRREKINLRLILMGQLLASILELVAIASTGAVISLVIRFADNQGPGDRVNFILSTLKLNNLSVQSLLLVMSLFALFIFVLRTFISIWFTRKSLLFSGEISARLSGVLAEFVLSGSAKTNRLNFNQQELAYAVTGGSVRLISGMIGSVALFAADTFLLSVVLLGLFLVDPASTSVMLVYFTALATLLHLLTNKRHRLSSRRSTETNLDSSHFFLETLSLYREFNLRDMIPTRIQTFSQYRITFSRFQAYLQVIPILSKYVVELGLIIGITFISLTQLLEFDFARSSATLALFVIAGSRLAPSVFRMQQNFSSILSTLESTHITQVLIASYKSSRLNPQFENLPNSYHMASVEAMSIDSIVRPFSGGIELKALDLHFAFDKKIGFEASKQEFLFANLSFSLKENTLNALIGKSGVGKSTLADLIIGAKTPSAGQVLMNGVSNTTFIKSFPGKVSFVPQNPVLLEGTLMFNVALKAEITDLEERRITTLIDELGLGDLYDSFTEKLQTKFSFGNRQLSGGQLQRLALARAMFTQPGLLVVDEYTSALDAESESRVTEFVREAAKLCTVLIITHRYRSILNCSQYLVLKSGQMSSFSELREAQERLDEK